MNRKFYWVLASLILLLGIVSLFLILQPDPEPQKVFKVPSPAVHPDANGDVSDSALATDHDDSAESLMPEKLPIEPIARKTAEGGYKVYRFDEFNKLPGPERDEAYRLWREDYKKRMGVEAAPLGEHYNHVKDEDGNVYRVYPNTVTFLKPKKMKIGYAPTLEQHKRMLKMHSQWHEAKDDGNTAEVNRLEAEMDKLKEEAQGEIPTLGPGVYESVGESPEEASRNRQRQIAAAMRQAYIDMNLEHLLPTYQKQ